MFSISRIGPVQRLDARSLYLQWRGGCLFPPFVFSIVFGFMMDEKRFSSIAQSACGHLAKAFFGLLHIPGLAHRTGRNSITYIYLVEDLLVCKCPAIMSHREAVYRTESLRLQETVR